MYPQWGEYIFHPSTAFPESFDISNQSYVSQVASQCDCISLYELRESYSVGMIDLGLLLADPE